MITKAEFKKFANMGFFQFETTDKDGNEFLCSLDGKSITFSSKSTDDEGVTKKYSTTDQAWEMWNSYMKGEKDRHDDLALKIEKKMVAAAKTAAKKVVARLHKVTLDNVDIEAGDMVNALIAYRYIIYGEYGNAYYHVRGLDTSAREYIDDRVDDLLCEFWALQY
jgi:hypothetical protein